MVIGLSFGEPAWAGDGSDAVLVIGNPPERERVAALVRATLADRRWIEDAEVRTALSFAVPEATGAPSTEQTRALYERLAVDELFVVELQPGPDGVIRFAVQRLQGDVRDARFGEAPSAGLEAALGTALTTWTTAPKAEATAPWVAPEFGWGFGFAAAGPQIAWGSVVRLSIPVVSDATSHVGVGLDVGLGYFHEPIQLFHIADLPLAASVRGGTRYMDLAFRGGVATHFVGTLRPAGWPRLGVLPTAGAAIALPMDHRFTAAVVSVDVLWTVVPVWVVQAGGARRFR